MQPNFIFAEEFYHIKESPFDTFKKKTSHYFSRFAMRSMRINYIPLYQYKGNSESFLVGRFAKVPSLNSRENGVLAGYFFKNSNYVYKHPSTFIKGAFFGKVRGQIQIFKVYLHSSLSFNSRGSNQNLRQGLKKIYPSTYVKAVWREKVDGLMAKILIFFYN